MLRNNIFKVTGVVFILVLLSACGGSGGEDNSLPGEEGVFLPDFSGKTVFYVNTSAADDSGDGLSPSMAKKTIPAAISAATAPAVILIAEGIYNVDSTPGTDENIILKEDVSLYGGFNSGFTVYNPKTYISEILDSNADITNNYITPGSAIYADGSTITSATVVDGLTIKGGSGAHSAAIFIDNSAAPVIQNNNINGGTGSARVYGVFSVDSAPTIAGNTINAGTTTGNYAMGLHILDGAPLIINNIILGGDSTGTFSSGIESSSAATILNNTIDGGSAGFYSTGIYINGSADGAPTIQNNIVFTSGGNTRLCIWEGNTVDPALLQNNDLFNCPAALYAAQVVGGTGNCSFHSGSNCHTQIADVNNETLTTQGAPGTADGNISVDPVFVDAASGDYHLGVTSPVTVTGGGLDLSPTITTDKDDFARTVPWSIGAYEF